MANDKFVFPDEAGGQDDAQAAAAAAKAKAKPEEEFEIETVDDTPVKDQGRQPLNREVTDPDETELQEYSEKVQARIKELTHARHDERRSKEAVSREKAELERVARALLEENKKLRGFVDTGSEQFIKQAQTLAGNEVEKAKKALKEAQDVFDSDAIVAAQDALMEAKIQAEAAKNFRPTTLQAEKTDVQTHQQASADEEPDERTLRWQQENQWFGADGKDEYTSFALGLHKKLMASGVSPNSEKYYEQIDARLKKVFPELYQQQGAGAEREQPQGQSSKKPASVVAPATRSSGTKKIQLTATQVALANRLNIPLQQYAAQVAKLENQNG